MAIVMAMARWATGDGAKGYNDNDNGDGQQQQGLRWRRQDGILRRRLWQWAATTMTDDANNDGNNAMGSCATGYDDDNNGDGGHVQMGQRPGRLGGRGWCSLERFPSRPPWFESNLGDGRDGSAVEST